MFCRLTDLQKKYYRRFLNSTEVQKIKNGKQKVLYGIDILRKICNHPDLVLKPEKVVSFINCRGRWIMEK